MRGDREKIVQTEPLLSIYNVPLRNMHGDFKGRVVGAIRHPRQSLLMFCCESEKKIFERKEYKTNKILTA